MVFVIMSKLIAGFAFAIRAVGFFLRLLVDVVHFVTFPVWFLLTLAVWPFFKRGLRLKRDQMERQFGAGLANMWRNEQPHRFWDFWDIVRR